MDHDAEKNAGEMLGAGWLVASCMALALAALGAWQVKTAGTGDMVEGAKMLLGAVAVMAVGGIGAVFGIVGASAAASAGNKRFITIVPAIANFALVLWFLASTFAP